jgi:hypothetical protein
MRLFQHPVKAHEFLHASRVPHEVIQFETNLLTLDAQSTNDNSFSLWVIGRAIPPAQLWRPQTPPTVRLVTADDYSNVFIPELSWHIWDAHVPAKGLLIRTPRISCPSFKSSVCNTVAPIRAAATTINASQNEIFAWSANPAAARIAA